MHPILHTPHSLTKNAFNRALSYENTFSIVYSIEFLLFSKKEEKNYVNYVQYVLLLKLNGCVVVC